MIVGSPYSYHRTYVDGQSLSVFVRPINDQADVFRITSNYFSIILDTNHTHRDIWDYIISLRTGFITERNTGLEYTPGESFAIPDEVGPVIWIGDDDILQSPSGDKYRLPVPVGLFGGWGDEGERNAMLTRGTLQPEKIIKGMLNNIERYRRLIILLGKLGEDTFKPDAVIPEK